MSAVADLFDGFELEVTAVPEEDGSYRLAVLIGEPISDSDEAQAVVEGFADTFGAALTSDLAGPGAVHVPSERLPLTPGRPA